MRTVVSGMIVSVSVVAAACMGPAPGSPPAQEQAPASAPASSGTYRPVVSLNQIMVAVIDSNSHKIWDAEALTTAPTDAQWAELEHSAVTLAAAGSLTAASGNGPNDQKWVQQPDWQKWSEAVSTAGLNAATAVKAKDQAGLRKAGDELVLTCINCHRQYKLDVPAIWSDHEQAH